MNVFHYRAAIDSMLDAHRAGLISNENLLEGGRILAELYDAQPNSAKVDHRDETPRIVAAEESEPAGPRKEYAFQSIDQAERLVSGANELLVSSDPSSVAAHARICRRVLDYVAATRRKIMAEQSTLKAWSSRHHQALVHNQNTGMAIASRMAGYRPGAQLHQNSKLHRIHLCSLRRTSLRMRAGEWPADPNIVSVPVQCDVEEVHGIPGVTHRCTNLSFGSERITIEEARKAKRRPFAGARLDELRAPPSLEELVSRGYLDRCLVLDPAISPRASYTPEPVPLLAHQVGLEKACDGSEIASLRAQLDEVNKEWADETAEHRATQINRDTWRSNYHGAMRELAEAYELLRHLYDNNELSLGDNQRIEEALSRGATK